MSESPDTEAIAATLNIAKKTGAVNTWLDAYRRDASALLAALATAEQAAEDLAEDRANWRAESKGYEAELAAAEAVVEAAEQMVDAIDEKPSLEWVAYASSLNDALNAYHKATGPQAAPKIENAQPGATGEGS